MHYRCVVKLKPGKRGRNQLRKRMSDGVRAEQANKRDYCYHLAVPRYLIQCLQDNKNQSSISPAFTT